MKDEDTDFVNSQQWHPGARQDVLRLRADLLKNIRQYFAEQHVMEVETPILSSASTTELHLASMSTIPLEGHHAYFLQTSPELFMKRLLAAGYGSIYQFARVFRRDEAGRHHNPEFTMLEWYRKGWSYHDLMDEAEELVAMALKDQVPEKAARYTYQNLFKEFVGLDPFSITKKEALAFVQQNDIDLFNPAKLQLDDLLDLILTTLIEPKLAYMELCFIYDYPASQASLARVRHGEPEVAERFELYYKGIELANGFQELTDASEQKQRMEADVKLRKKLKMEAVPVDQYFIRAMEQGLPECSGVALGFDRLLMAATGAANIADVMAFDFGRV